MVNEYVREHKIGSGSYGKVVSIVFVLLCCHSSPCLVFETIFYMHDRLYTEVVRMESIMQSRYEALFWCWKTLVYCIVANLATVSVI